MNATPERFESWAIVELMGHRRVVGRVVEQEVAGFGFLRIDVPEGDGWKQSQLVNPSSVYAIHPVSEEAARLAAQTAPHEPVTVWELPDHIRRAVQDAETFGRDDDDDDQEWPL